MKTPAEVAQDVREEFGNWMISECGCLDDMIWKVSDDYRQMNDVQRKLFETLVSEEIYG